jgi:hypothetical protein
MRWARQVAGMGKNRNAFRSLIGKLEGKRPFDIPKLRQEDIIKVREIGFEVMDLVHMAHDKYRWMVRINLAVNLRVP